MTVTEVAEMMRVSRMTVYRMIHAGDLPAVRFGRSYRVPQEAVQAIVSGTDSATRTAGHRNTFCRAEPPYRAGLFFGRYHRTKQYETSTAHQTPVPFVCCCSSDYGRRHRTIRHRLARNFHYRSS